jgi:hypothetical protein
VTRDELMSKAAQCDRLAAALGEQDRTRLLALAAEYRQEAIGLPRGPQHAGGQWGPDLDDLSSLPGSIRIVEI